MSKMTLLQKSAHVKNPSVNSPFESSSWLRLVLTGFAREAGLTLLQLCGMV
jgi:hypothetical protein